MPPEPRASPVDHRSWREIALYGAPALAVSAPVYFVQFYFLSFATDVLLLAPAIVGGLLALGRIWDAVTDPLAGYGSDRTRSRWGRRRPWMLVAAPASALAFVALWNPPAGVLSSAALAVWSGFWLLALTTAVTAWGIPHQAMGAELSEDANVRHRVFGLRFMTSLVGVALSFGAMQLVGNADHPRAMAASLSWVFAAAMLSLLLVPVFAVRERGSHQAAISVRPFRAAREVVTSPNARRLLGVWFAAQLGMASQGVIAPYMAFYVLKRPDFIGVLPALFIVPLVWSVPLWIVLARRFGAKRVWQASMFGGAFAYAALWFMPFGGMGWVALLLGTAGFFTGCGGPLGPSFFADLADGEARHTGEHREGVYFAAKEFVEKASGASVALVVGIALQLSGFEPNVDQNPTTLFAIRGCLSILPAATLLVGALLLAGYRVQDGPTRAAVPAAALPPVPLRARGR